MDSTQELSIVYVPTKTIKLDTRNSRTHSPAQVQQIADSISKFGFTNPVLLDQNNVLIAGEGRVKGALKLKLKKVPAIYLSHLSERERRAYAIADNKLALNSGWNWERLTEEISALSEMEFDIDLIGFNEQEIDAILKGDPGILPDDWQGKQTEVAAHTRKLKTGKTADDDAPKVQPKPITTAGDVWVLGSHRLVCGDCRNPETVAAVLSDFSPRIMVTDPPYGVEYDGAWRDEHDDFGRHRDKPIANDHVFDWTDAWKLSPSEVAYVWNSSFYLGEVSNNLKGVGYEIRSLIIWVKQQMNFGRGHYHFQHEPCFYAVRKGGTAGWIGDRKQTTVWQFPNANPYGGAKDDELTDHSTQKPVEAMLRPMLNHSGDVYDPFGGSGTTIIAAEKAGRRCFMVELESVWCDVIVRRWQNFTGLDAIREADGAKFNSLTHG